MNNTAANTDHDKILVERALHGDKEAFKTIIRNTESLTTQTIYKMIANPSDRKDIAQDVYLNVFKGLGSFRSESKLSTWIAQVAYNCCLGYLRKKKLILVPAYEDLPAREVVSHNQTAQVVHSRELSGILRTEIDKLPPLYKTLITLYHNEELSYAEIVEITGLPEGTVKSYLYRARKSLRETLLSSYKKESL